MENNILVAGCSTQRGTKIIKFLQHKGFNVFGVDRYFVGALKSFFRMDMRHKESMKMAITIAKPTVVIFCPAEQIGQIDYNYPAFSSVIVSTCEAKVKKLVLCLDDIYLSPKSVNEISQLAMYYLTDVFKNEFGMEILVITQKGNLLKEIKQFVLEKGGDINVT